MSISRSASFFCPIALLVTTVFAANAAVTPSCSAPQEITRFMVELPNTARAIQMHEPLVIVAIGSSSTEGVGASDSAHTYPAVLGKELEQRWPEVMLRVINKGVGGEIASQMLARFSRDVLSHGPQLVIWQTGSNQTLRSDDLDQYAEIGRA